MTRTKLLTTLAGATALGAALWAPAASACGCFTPPDPTVPIVQAGERILFAVDQGMVTSHVQIQYAGTAAEFGWLLPLPSVPTLELGSDEVFTDLYATTQPKYRLNLTFDSSCPQAKNFPGPAYSATDGTNASEAGGGSSPGVSPLVVQDSIGPYDYAVLKADSKDAMLNWLSTNRYFVPAGTDDTVAPYIRPGSYFLALKLRSGKAAGDLQPVVLHYASDAAMIPILLTSTGAQENMGVQVWMLGQGRAIPRNYHHTVINDALIDWQKSGANYNEVIIKAAGEAPGSHTFVTEFAGKSTVMSNQLSYPGRFGDTAILAAQPTALSFVNYLNAHGYARQNVYPAPLKAILAKYIPVPPKLAAQGISADQFYASYQYYTTSTYYAKDLTDWTVDYQPQVMTDAIVEAVIKPTLAAGALFNVLPYLTRLYTTISPKDMNKDPVFSFNRGLPDIANVHEAKMKVGCNSITGSENSAWLTTEQGWNLNYPNGRFKAAALDLSTMPASLRIEILREEGLPVLATDNLQVISTTVNKAQGFGCSASGATALLMGLWPAAWLLLRSRRRS